MKTKFKKSKLAIIGIIILLLVKLTLFNTTICFVSCHNTRTQTLFSGLSTACRAYLVEYGNYPSSFENKTLTEILIGNNPRKIVFMEFRPKDLNQNNEIIDGWGTPIRIMIQPDQTLSFLSAGKDKTFNTSDDIKR